VFVDGVGVAGAIIKLYIDDVYAGVGTTGSNGAFTNVGITGITLTEGVKVLHVTATLPGLAESDASTAYTFTYDKTVPTIASVVGDSSSSYITVTFSEPVTASTAVAATWSYSSKAFAYSAPATTPVTVTSPSSTTVILYEGAGGTDPLLATGDFLSVKCSVTAIKDLAGNLMVIPVTAYGFVVE